MPMFSRKRMFNKTLWQEKQKIVFGSLVSQVLSNHTEFRTDQGWRRLSVCRVLHTVLREFWIQGCYFGAGVGGAAG